MRAPPRGAPSGCGSAGAPSRASSSRPARAAAASALLEEHDAPLAPVEEAPVPRIEPSPRTAVQEDDRPALGVAALLEVEAVAGGHLQASGLVGLDRRKEFSHGLLGSWRR